MDAREALTVDIPQLRSVLDGLLRQYETRHGSKVYVDRDHYWLIELEAALSEDLHVPGTQEDDLGVGQISDDIESVAESAAELLHEGKVAALWHDLQHAAGLIRALAWVDVPPPR